LVEALEAILSPLGNGRFVRLSGNDVACSELCEGFWIEARVRPDDELTRRRLLAVILRMATRMHVVWKRKGHDLPAYVLVDAAVTRLREEPGQGHGWLECASVADEAAVLLMACDRLDRFQRDFPDWPMSSPVRVEPISAHIGDGLTLIGNPDLAFGTPGPTGDGVQPVWATTLTIIAPGESMSRAKSRVRFDQLVETLRFGGPPAESLIWEPESGEQINLAADEKSLQSAALDAAIAAERLREILTDGQVILCSGPTCGSCPRAADCTVARHE
jgi:hypothetical protein